MQAPIFNIEFWDERKKDWIYVTSRYKLTEAKRYVRDHLSKYRCAVTKEQTMCIIEPKS